MKVFFLRIILWEGGISLQSQRKGHRGGGGGAKTSPVIHKVSISFYWQGRTSCGVTL